MKHTTIFAALMLFIISSCTSGEKKESNTINYKELAKPTEVTLKKIDINLDNITMTTALYVDDDYLYVVDGTSSTTFLSTYDKNTLEFKRSFITKGKAKNEVLTFSSLSIIGDKVVVFDQMTSKFSSYNKHSGEWLESSTTHLTPSSAYAIALNDELYAYSSVLEEPIITIATYEGEKRDSVMFEAKSEALSKVGDNMMEKVQAALTYMVTISYDETTQQLSGLSAMGEFMAIKDMKSGTERFAIGPSGVMKNVDMTNPAFLIDNSGFGGSSTSKGKIFTLFRRDKLNLDITKVDINNISGLIKELGVTNLQVHNMKGEIIEQYLLNKGVLNIAVDKSRKRVYCVVASDSSICYFDIE